MANYSKHKMKCKTCGYVGKALIKEYITEKWYRCIKCKEMIGEMNDPNKECICKQTCGFTCKGECGCKKCHDDYQDYLTEDYE